jgi:hypothetical protein|tara:strand:- start:65 stop:373 length:309 start_codon:yes stop_codon:yes gene_type:complete
MAENKVSKRKWAGNVPDGDGWNIAGITEERYGVKWVVSIKDPAYQNCSWRNIKVSANGMVEIKANYRTAWDGERFASSRDLFILRENRPGLESAVTDVLNIY